MLVCNMVYHGRDSVRSVVLITTALFLLLVLSSCVRQEKDDGQTNKSGKNQSVGSETPIPEATKESALKPFHDQKTETATFAMG